MEHVLLAFFAMQMAHLQISKMVYHLLVDSANLWNFNQIIITTTLYQSAKFWIIQTALSL